MQQNTIQTVLLIIIALMTGRLLVAGRAPKASSGRQRTILDTCALIDGRILELCANGFMPGQIIIPQFILSELQQLADGGDAYKRERARFGLEVVQRLQSLEGVNVAIDNHDFPSIKEVDDKLVALAQKLSARLYTTDYNLNKVADIKGVLVLNVNELAGSLRPVALPGEGTSVKIIQKGSNKNQGVGYLGDGTMVVVDGAAAKIGQNVEVTVTRTHQTVAGKMLFADLAGSVKQQPKGRSSKRRATSTQSK